MSTPKSRDQELCEMFDSFSHRTIANIGKYMRRKHFNHKNRFSTFAPELLEDVQSCTDTYPSNRYVVTADELRCRVNNEFLYKAFQEMPLQQRKVLILDFWYHCKDQQIANYLGVSVRTVYNLRQRAYRTIIEEQRKQDT